MTDTEQAADEWAIVELFGHIRTAGRVSEVERFGVKLMRLDIPGDDGDFVATQLIGGAALYRVTPTTEDTARRVAALGRPAPVKAWQLSAVPHRDEPDDEEVDSEGFSC